MAAGNNDDHLDTSNKQNVTHISIGEIGDFNVKHQFVVGVGLSVVVRVTLTVCH